MMKMDSTRKKRERNKGMEKERLQVMDLSGMNLDSLPKPSLDLATIYKLDLSNNNLQVSFHSFTHFFQLSKQLIVPVKSKQHHDLSLQNMMFLSSL